jgi:hypothetical protein
MLPWYWTGRQLGLFWLAAGAVVLLLLAVPVARRAGTGSSFFWLIPYPESLPGLLRTLGIIFTSRPLEATALLVVPALSLGVTLLWLLAQLWRR